MVEGRVGCGGGSARVSEALDARDWEKREKLDERNALERRTRSGGGRACRGSAMRASRRGGGRGEERAHCAA